MLKRSPTRICAATIISLLVLVLSVNFLSGSVAISTTVTPDPDLDALVQQYENLNSVQLVASVEVSIGQVCCDTVTAAPGEVIAAHYEYSAAGDKYWVLSRFDQSMASAMDYEVAYNGDEFQVLQMAQSPGDLSTLRIGDGDRDLTIPVVPNPFLIPLEFVYVRDDTNWFAPLKLSEVERDAATISRISGVQRTTVTVDGRTLERAVFSGGHLDGDAFELHVYTPIGRRSQPVLIDYVTDVGIMVSTEMSHYRTATGGASGAYWPRSIVVSSFDEQGELAARISYVITSLVVDEEIDPWTFTIDPARADRIWSETHGEFIE